MNNQIDPKFGRAVFCRIDLFKSFFISTYIPEYCKFALQGLVISHSLGKCSISLDTRLIFLAYSLFSGDTLVAYSLYTRCILVVYSLHTRCILVAYSLYTRCILVAYSLHFDCILRVVTKCSNPSACSLQVKVLQVMMIAQVDGCTSPSISSVLVAKLEQIEKVFPEQDPRKWLAHNVLFLTKHRCEKSCCI